MTVEHHRRASSYVSGSSRDNTTHHTSSAFSASAQPDEDWTKISDLAERRRIQNRIAQRNYRKKLKKRLEDLEKKAASSSPSPEQRPAELPKPKTKSTRRASSPISHHRNGMTNDEWPMFSNQHTRQISTSPPPPFSFPPLDSFASLPSPPLPASTLPYMSSTSIDYPQGSSFQYQSFQTPIYDAPSNTHWPKQTRQDSILENAISPVNMSGYMSMGPMDVSFPSTALPDASYVDAPTAFTDASLTPELCDFYDRSSAGSPTEYSAFPQTPLMLPMSPPFSTSFDFM